MKAEDYSEWTFQQLTQRLHELLQQIEETDRKDLPVDELLAECNLGSSARREWRP